MLNGSKTAMLILEGGLFLGVLGDLLFRSGGLGVNFLLWMCLFFFWSFTLLRRARRFELAEASVFFAMALFCALGVAWRESPMLILWDICGICLALVMIAWHGRGKSLRSAGALDYLSAALLAAKDVIVGAPMLILQDLTWKDKARPAWMRRATSVAVGIALAIPLLFFFGVLLAAADSIFAQLLEMSLKRIVDVPLDEIFSHVFAIAFLTWVVSGFLRGMAFGTALGSIGRNHGDETISSLDLSGTKSSERRLSKMAGQSLGIVEVGLPLGLLNLLFLAFVIVQFRYLFGGASLVEVTTGLTYSEYARHGFFELVVVAALVLSLLWGAQWIIERSGDQRGEKVFRALAIVQLLLVGIIMLSALRRMLLYTDAYGLTTSRFYATAFMCWLAAVFMWFAVTVLRGRRARFLYGAVSFWLVLLVALHAMNPEGFIVRVNAARADFDVTYAATLSDDAVPALIQALPDLAEDQRRKVAEQLLQSVCRPTEERTDWRNWTVAKWQAARACAKAGLR